ncbi:MAG: chromosome segregation protein SMC, partial [Firmicutes bacterium]|nr:chromosome segregation protein SMC [Bacillota bacterium]
EAAGVALETLREASDGVHREFAPALNRKVTGITSRITGGRYTDLRITTDLKILATAPETGRRVEAQVLSGGTVDQLYFALRIAASEFLSGDRKLPLILDDCFVQYDWHRLENTFAYILEEARERQIILFTCHDRERKVAEALGGVYNYLILE